MCLFLIVFSTCFFYGEILLLLFTVFHSRLLRSVTFAGKVPKSPFSVMVEGHVDEVTASGPGLGLGVIAGKPTCFDVFTKDAGQGQVEVIIDSNVYRNTVPCNVRKVSDNVFRCNYVAQTTGMHSVDVFFAGQQIPESPFSVIVTPVKASGRGKDIAVFIRIYIENASEGQFEVKVIGPGGAPEKIDVKKFDETRLYCAYYPQKEGCYVVMISLVGVEMQGSPYEVHVVPCQEPQIRACGSGVHGVVVGKRAVFTVETNGETGSLEYSIGGPSDVKIDCSHNGDGSADIKHHPTASDGKYYVHILCNDEGIPRSPYSARIFPETDYHPDKVGLSIQFAGKEIHNSPITVAVEPQLDVSKVKVEGLESSVQTTFHQKPCDRI